MLSPTDHVIDLVDDYLHELLSPEDSGILDEHCSRCPICRVALDEARRRFALFPSVPAPPAPTLLRERAIGNVEALGGGKASLQGRISFSAAYVVAAAVLVLATLHVFVYRLAPSPFDLRVLGQSELLVDSAAALRLAVFDHRTGELVQDVPVELTLINPGTHERNWLANINTSNLNAATTQFRLPKWAPGKYQLEILARTSDGLEVIRRDVQLLEAWNIHLSTDKPVYQPGQTIRVRSLALRKPELRPLVGEKVEFTIADPSGNLIFRERDVTSAYGLANAECALADELIEGSYRIECRVGDTTVSRSVEVQKYTLPKFKVTLELEKPFYAPGEKVKGTLSAAYFFGKPVTGGSVEIQAQGGDVTSAEVAGVLAKTDEAGKAPFEFALPANLVGTPREGGLARIRVVAKVTDAAGQMQTGAVARVVTQRPILLDVLPENGALVRGVPNQIFVLARYADGRPARARLAVTDVKQELTANELGVATFELTPSATAVSLTVKATDEAGLVGQRQVNLQSGEISDDFLVRTDKAVYEGGEAITLTALGGGEEPVYIDLLKNGQTVLTEVLELAQGKATEQVTLPETVFGTLELVAYRFNANGDDVRKTRLLHVRPAKQLKITATLAKEEFLPGEKTPLRILLTDAQGNPVVGAVSLAAVDEAVYSVLNERGSLDQAFFLLDRQMLRPVYAMYDDWLPTPKASPSKQLLDLAVFSAAASSTSGSDVLPLNFTGVPSAEERKWPRPTADATSVGDPGAVNRLARMPVLSGTSFPEKQERIERQRQQGLHNVFLAWGALVGVALVMGVVYFVLFVRSTVIHILLGVAVCAIIAAILLPAGQRGREFGKMATPPKTAAPDWEMKSHDAVKAAGDAAKNVGEAARPAGVAAAAVAPKSTPIRTRDYFPETLLWRPEIITDASGAATVELELADSITTWRLSGSAVSAQGRLGAGEWPIKVFQSFFIDLNAPATLTRNDEIELPVVVYNYLDRPQRVKLVVVSDKWFEFRTADEKGPAGTFNLDLAAGEVRAVPVPIKVLAAGQQKLYVTAQGTGASDRLERALEVLPDGRRVEQVAGGTLEQPAEHAFDVPEMRIDGSTRCLVKLYPSTFSQVLDGLDGIFRMPSGCFEQTSSTTYPNVLALEYLKRTKSSSPAQEVKARQYIHVGYQRLLTFEVPGGGFEWFGHAPAKGVLTAYGLAEFEDMAQLYDVEPSLLARTRRWLLEQRLGNGAWGVERSGALGGAIAAGAKQTSNKGDLATTAYVATAVFSHGQAGSAAPPTLSYLLAQSEKVENPYVLALVIRAIATIEPAHEKLKELSLRLDLMKKSDATGRLVWWELPAGTSTLFYGGGPSGNVETTANAALALLAADRAAGSVRGASAWLAAQRDARGTWNSTQATIMALKALIEATGKSPGGNKSRRAEIAINGEVRFNAVIEAEQADVVRTVDLTPEIKSGHNQISITDITNSAMGYQLVVRYHVPTPADPPEKSKSEPLAIRLEYDRRQVALDDMVIVSAEVENKLERAAPMAIVDLPIPAGFALKTEDLDQLVAAKTIERYQITPRKAILYFRELAPGVPVELIYRLQAVTPVKVQVPGAQVYLYYDPDQRGTSPAVTLEATGS